MDIKARLALKKKKRELLGNVNKRKMSLRKYMDNLKQGECTLDITQITKCVFLGSLCLKPVPQLFDSPLLLEELDMKADHEPPKDVLNINDKETKVHVKKRRCLNVPKISKKWRDRNDARNTSPNQDSEKLIIKQFIKISSPENSSDTQSESPGEQEVPDAPQAEKVNSPETPPNVPQDDTVDYEDLFTRDDTPELLLPDSDDDTIDQLMFNIMDIKLGQNVFDLEMSDPDSEFEQYSPEPTRDSPDNKKLRRKPQCKICSQIFPSYMQLNKHKATHNGDKPYLCVKCNENYTTLDQLLAHLRTHQGKRPYVCKKCNNDFKTLKALQNHEPVHVLRKDSSPKKMFRCDVCGKEFRKLCDLERHTRVHTGEKPSVCNICNRRFQQAHNLNKHLLIHTQEKPFQCDICNKKFGRSDVLNRHLLTHSVKKPNRCEICMKSFIRISQLLIHKDKYHPKEKQGT